MVKLNFGLLLIKVVTVIVFLIVGVANYFWNYGWQASWIKQLPL